MKLTIIVALLLFAGSRLTAQNLQLYPDFYDSSGVNSYDFHVSGLGTFSATMLLDVHVTSADSLHTSLFTGAYDFSGANPPTLTGWTYDSQTGIFSFSLGNFPDKAIELWIRLYDSGILNEELLIVEFD